MRKTVWLAACAAMAIGHACLAQTPQKQPEESPFQKLHWIHGPKTVDVGNYGKLMVPKGYMYLAPADARKFDELNQNLPVDNENILAPERLGWFTAFTFDDIGYVKDNDTLHPDAILKDLRQNTEADNKIKKTKGWPTLSILGWLYKPHYDKTDKRLEWATRLRDSNGMSVANFNTKILGRKGVVSVLLVADPKSLDSAVSTLKVILPGFKFDNGLAYSDYRSGDKIAEYGLAGLITGGVVAVAAKSGLLKALIKFIWVGVVGLLAAIRKFFGKSKKAAKTDNVA